MHRIHHTCLNICTILFCINPNAKYGGAKMHVEIKKNACGDNASAPLNLLVIAEANRSSSTKLTKKKPCLGGTRDFFDIVEAGLGVIILKFVSNRN
jgi:hypothetical protein